MDPVGFEPTLFCLQHRCSPVELRARVLRRRDSNPNLPGNNRGSCRLNDIGSVAICVPRQGFEPRFPD